VLTVTDLTKVLNGVRNRVLWDQDFQQGELTESELTFFAQDDGGNVWNLGEYRKSTRLVSSPARRSPGLVVSRERRPGFKCWQPHA